MSRTDPKAKYYRIGSLEKGVKIIDLLTRRGPLSLSEVAAELKVDRSVCHRALLTLRDLGLVSQPGGSGYRLTMSLFEMGMRLVNRLEVKQVVRPFMEKLSGTYRETVNLGIKDGDQVVYLDRTESTQLVRADLAIGTRIPIHCTALGKAILANLPIEESDRIFEKPLEKLTEKTNVDRIRLLEEFADVRLSGYSVDDEGIEHGLYCLAVPIYNYTGSVVAAISISGPFNRVTENRQKVVQELKSLGGMISRRLGYVKAMRSRI